MYGNLKETEREERIGEMFQRCRRNPDGCIFGNDCSECEKLSEEGRWMERTRQVVL